MRIPGLADQVPWKIVKRAVKDFLTSTCPPTPRPSPSTSCSPSFHSSFSSSPSSVPSVSPPSSIDSSTRPAPPSRPTRSKSWTEVGRDPQSTRPRAPVLQHCPRPLGGPAGMRSVTNALNRAYDVDETRPIWQRSLSPSFTPGVGGVVLFSGRLASRARRSSSGSPVASDHRSIATLWTWLRWPVVVMLLLLFVALIYYLGPQSPALPLRHSRFRRRRHRLDHRLGRFPAYISALALRRPPTAVSAA